MSRRQLLPTPVVETKRAPHLRSRGTHFIAARWRTLRAGDHDGAVSRTHLPRGRAELGLRHLDGADADEHELAPGQRERQRVGARAEQHGTVRPGEPPGICDAGTPVP